MKFTIPAGELAAGLKSVQARARTTKNIDVFKHVKFSAADSRLTLLALDMSSSSEAYLQAEVQHEGACAVPAESIIRLVGSLPRAAHITVELDEKQVTVKTGRSRYKLPVLDTDSYPDALQIGADAVSVELDAKAVLQLFDRPRAALDPDDQRAFCQGAYIHSVDNVVCAAATDGKHFVRYASDISCPSLIGVIVPISALDEIAKLGAGKLSVSDRTVSFETSDRRFCTKLIEERYVDYANGVPRLINNYVEVDRAELLACFQRLLSVAASDSQLHLSVGDGEISLSVAGAGDGAEVVGCSGEPLKGAFVAASPQHFVDSMKMLCGEIVQLHIEPGCRAFRIVDPFEPTAMLAQSIQVPRNRVAA